MWYVCLCRSLFSRLIIFAQNDVVHALWLYLRFHPGMRGSIPTVKNHCWAAIVDKYRFTELGFGCKAVGNIPLGDTHSWVLQRTMSTSATSKLPYLRLGSFFYRASAGPACFF